MRGLYTLLLILIAPLVFIWLAVRSRRQTGAADPWRERCGGIELRGAGPVIWIHAASLGEVQAASALVNELIARYPGHRLLVTTFTATARRRAGELFGNRAAVSALPYDLPWCVARFLGRAHPAMAVMIETELWPNLYHALARRRVPIVIVSARLSPRAFVRYRRWRPLVAPLLAVVTRIGAQTRLDAERFVALGAGAEHVSVIGNLKFDNPPPDDAAAGGDALRRRYFGGRPVWVAGSTRAGEEETLLAAFKAVRARVADCALVVAPRHPERAQAVAALAAAAGMDVALRSSGHESLLEASVLIVDRVGELIDFYAAADMVFVGGTCVDIGGHNILEPAALGRPIVTGPHLQNWRDLAAAMSARGGLTIAADADELATAAINLLTDADARERAGEAARAAVEDNRGALERALKLIDAVIPAD